MDENKSDWVTVEYLPTKVPTSYMGNVTGQTYIMGPNGCSMHPADARAAFRLRRHGKPIFGLFVEAVAVAIPDVRDEPAEVEAEESVPDVRGEPAEAALEAAPEAAAASQEKTVRRRRTTRDGK